MGNIRDLLKKDILAVKAKKINSQPGDGHQNGDKCIIIAESQDSAVGIIYLAIFEDFPLPIGVADFRIELLTERKKKRIKLTQQQVNYLADLPENMFNYYTDAEEKEGKKSVKNRKKNSEKQGN